MFRNNNDALRAYDDYLNSAGDESVMDYETQARMEAEDERRARVWASANTESFLEFLQGEGEIQNMLDSCYITPECFVETAMLYLECSSEKLYYNELTANICDYVEDNLRDEYIDWAIENEEYLQ